MSNADLWAATEAVKELGADAESLITEISPRDRMLLGSRGV
jgi:hypothetical protein